MRSLEHARALNVVTRNADSADEKPQNILSVQKHKLQYGEMGLRTSLTSTRQAPSKLVRSTRFTIETCMCMGSPLATPQMMPRWRSLCTTRSKVQNQDRERTAEKRRAYNIPLFAGDIPHPNSHRSELPSELQLTKQSLPLPPLQA